jgi:hypothetical protein
MAEGVRSIESRIVRALSLVLVAGAGIRLLTAVIAGFVEWHDSASSPFADSGRARAFDVLSTFGAAGDGTGVLLAGAAAIAVCWLWAREDAFAEALTTAVVLLFGATALLAVADGVAAGLIYSVQCCQQTSHLIEVEGFALAYLVIAVGAVVLLRRIGSLIEDRLATDDLDAFVFAVDRHTGDVRAFFSVGEARRRMHVYSVEDDEFAFYSDEGVILDATVEDERIVLRPTQQEQPAELLERLKDFANRRGITIDEADTDDPTAYAVPFSRWHWLEMWPPWLRPIGMLFRRNG